MRPGGHRFRFTLAERGAFPGYPPLKRVANFLFQRFFARLYRCPVTDFTFGYRLYPTALVKAIAWQETGHAFVFESLVKPLRLSVAVREIPTIWRRRCEGTSQLRPWAYLRYLGVGFKARWARPGGFLK